MRERGSVSTLKPLIQTMKDSGEGFMKGGCRGKNRRNIISTSLTPEPRCRCKVQDAVVTIAVDIRGCAGARTGVRLRLVRGHRVHIWGVGRRREKTSNNSSMWLFIKRRYTHSRMRTRSHALTWVPTVGPSYIRWPFIAAAVALASSKVEWPKLPIELHISTLAPGNFALMVAARHLY